MNLRRLTPILVDLIRCGLQGEPLAIDQVPNLGENGWRDLLRLATAHDVSPLLYAALTGAPAGSQPPWMNDLRRQAVSWEWRNDAALEQLSSVLAAMNTQGIEPVILKGALFAVRYYRTPGHRPFSDLDILVPLAALEQAAGVLTRAGYRDFERDGLNREVYRAQHNHWIFIPEKGLPVELHWLLTPPCSEVQFDPDALVARSTRISYCGAHARALAPEDEVVAMAVHAAKHQFRTPLRQYVDLAALLAHSPDLDWSQVQARAQESGATADLHAFLGVAAHLGLADAPATACEAPISAAELARFVVAAPFYRAPTRLVRLLTAGPSVEARQTLGEAVLASGASATGAKESRTKPGGWRRRVGELLEKRTYSAVDMKNLRTTVQVKRLFGNREAP